MELDYKSTLTQIFGSNHGDDQINEVVTIVLEQTNLSPEEKLEEMINLLVESGDSTLSPSAVEEEEGATGITLNNSHSESFRQNLDELRHIFPDIDINYLTDFCQNYEPFDFDRVVQALTQIDYRRAEADPLDVWDHLKQMLPDADPTYLRNQARVLARRPEGELEEFIANAIENNDYPTMQDYLINKELEADLALYLTRFSVSKYLMRVPNPLEIFFDPKRTPILSGEEINQSDLEFALIFLYNQFTYQRKTEIMKVFSHYGRDLVKTCNRLKNLPKAFRHPRTVIAFTECKNVDLLKEISFLKHEKQIRQFLKKKNERYTTAVEEARIHGLLQTCGCCYDDELIPEECYFCNKGCVAFCKDCVRSGAENVIGKEETVFPCLGNCDSEFDYSTLQMILDIKTFQKICQRKQIEEIRNANIDGLETCPFCDFCMIPNEDDKIFKCQNVHCMAETCRQCRHKSHIPLRCNEIEYDEDVKMRTFIENKMTEALLRKCWKCSKQFYKESGCNKMTCVCGARMCYVCGQAVTDYSHFNSGQCPLYTENLPEFHRNRVMQGAQAAKSELGITADPGKLKFDPTRGVERDVQ